MHLVQAGASWPTVRVPCCVIRERLVHSKEGVKAQR
jgi:hypothetical protein